MRWAQGATLEDGAVGDQSSNAAGMAEASTGVLVVHSSAGLEFGWGCPVRPLRPSASLPSGTLPSGLASSSTDLSQSHQVQRMPALLASMKCQG